MGDHLLQAVQEPDSGDRAGDGDGGQRRDAEDQDQDRGHEGAAAHTGEAHGEADDAHQDHRVIAEIVPTVFRDQLYLAYEIPKWDGDLNRPSVYFPLAADTARRKVELLHKCVPSQRNRDWWDDEVFLGMARLRGMECRAPYAEAFTCAKSLIQC